VWCWEVLELRRKLPECMWRHSRTKKRLKCADTHSTIHSEAQTKRFARDFWFCIFIAARGPWTGTCWPRVRRQLSIYVTACIVTKCSLLLFTPESITETTYRFHADNEVRTIGGRGSSCSNTADPTSHAVDRLKHYFLTAALIPTPTDQIKPLPWRNSLLKFIRISEMG
jgi:hypothetical protein